MMGKIDIKSLNLRELEYEFTQMGEKKFRAKQVYDWLHIKNVSSFDKMSNVSVQLINQLDNRFYITSLKVIKKLVSCIDNTVKYLYELNDKNFVETVLMQYKHGMSICISTQVGCKMGCKFCASTKAGFIRNLTPSEMLEQIYHSSQESGKKISSIVLMGIGEPLDNLDNVIRFLELISNENGYNMSLRHVSLSTCGLVDKIDELAKLKLGLTLSISLHAPNDEIRNKTMPVNKVWNVDKLIESCKRYTNATKRRISFEYALIKGKNDSEKEARELAKKLKGMLCHVNLIPVNKVSETNFSPSDKSAAYKFQKILMDQGITTTIRRTLGSDINAACGQLRTEHQEGG
jgi:23S rRNA (adenine2503-C2)-methyltransferase